MFHSEKHNLLFIANPKTGTTSVEYALLDIDPEGQRFKVKKGDHYFSHKEMRRKTIGHAKAKEFREAIGADFYDSLRTFVFVRHPYSKLVSSYFYLRRDHLFKRKHPKGWKYKVLTFGSKLLAKLLPFKLWALVYPYKANTEYVLDFDGRRIVDAVGRTEHLEADLQRILERFDVPTDRLAPKQLNTSAHNDYDIYFTTPWFKRLMEKRMRADLDLYDAIDREMEELSATRPQVLD